jgi:hypothetical protein
MLFSHVGAVLFFTLLTTVATVVLIEGKLNIARFGTPRIVKRASEPLIYWVYVAGIIVCLMMFFMVAPRK